MSFSDHFVFLPFLFISTSLKVRGVVTFSFVTKLSFIFTVALYFRTSRVRIVFFSLSFFSFHLFSFLPTILFDGVCIGGSEGWKYK